MSYEERLTMDYEKLFNALATVVACILVGAAYSIHMKHLEYFPMSFLVCVASISGVYFLDKLCKAFKSFAIVIIFALFYFSGKHEIIITIFYVSMVLGAIYLLCTYLIGPILEINKMKQEGIEFKMTPSLFIAGLVNGLFTVLSSLARILWNMVALTFRLIFYPLILIRSFM